MSSKEVDRELILRTVQDKQISLIQASQLLSLSYHVSYSIGSSRRGVDPMLSTQGSANCTHAIDYRRDP